ncbi:hypothetical protein GCWU000325_00875 [Alloprevotella tannerae ATCC 51259]|uniref:Uncharacterized protein n=1 Tax=Alloprevotella tannerae ATCC 51259 TaxID=626522 RepID=C9LF93_9BACT|nr:hypothetical protein GCWU000325_00875 [Alloprevotella tannerae ATCC 51259]
MKIRQEKSRSYLVSSNPLPKFAPPFQKEGTYIFIYSISLCT